MKWAISEQAHRWIGLGLVVASVAVIAAASLLKGYPALAQYRTTSIVQEGRYAAMTITRPAEPGAVITDFHRFE